MSPYAVNGRGVALPIRRSPNGCLFTLLLALALWLGLVAGARWVAAQAPVPHTYTTPDQLHDLREEAKRDTALVSQYHGAVGCDTHEDVPVIQHLVPAGDSLARAETVRHEATHFVQLAKAGCRATLNRWMAEPMVWLVAEAEAACTGFEVYPRAEQRHARMIKSILVVAFRRPPGISLRDIWSAFEEACGEPSSLDRSYRP
jgi:hypothetical protein